MTSTTTTQPSELLADPTQVALLRELFAHARQVKALHNTYAFVGVTGRPYGSLEHQWIADRDVVSVEDGRLTYKRNGVLRLTAEVSDLRQAVDLLVALDILPQHFSSAYKAGVIDGNAPAPTPVTLPFNPDRRCRYCRATSGLILRPGNPLTGAGRGYECADGCKAATR